MAITAGPSLVRNGLLLSLSASDVENYALSEVEVLVVAGGGGGGHQVGGGGGAGGLIYNSSYKVTPGSAISVTVGNGGSGAANGSTAATNGQNSVFGYLTAIGGGRGANHETAGGIGANGGSGGGGAGASQGVNGYGTNGAGGSGTLGQGNAGGFGRGSTAQNFSGNGWAGGGGGGAGQPGFPSTLNGKGGKGGDGLLLSISGSSVWYAGGGGGCENSEAPAVQRSPGGLGGGGLGKGNDGTTIRLNGTANTGGGGGGVRDPATAAGNGGSGVVIVRYPGTQKATGGNTITSVNGYTIHTFTGSGTFTPQSTQTLFGVSDLGPNKRNFQILGSPTYSSTIPESFTFNGNGQGLSLLNVTTDAPELTSETFLGNSHSIEVWFRLSTTAATGEDATEGAQGLVIWPGYHSGVVQISNGLRFYLWNNGLTTVYDHFASVSWSTNVWYQIIHTMDYGSSRARWYLNASLIDTRTDVPSSFVRSITADNRINIGAARLVSTPNSYRWRLNNGQINSVRFYNRPLSADEIRQNFNALRGRFGV